MAGGMWGEESGDTDTDTDTNTDIDRKCESETREKREKRERELSVSCHSVGMCVSKGVCDMCDVCASYKLSVNRRRHIRCVSVLCGVCVCYVWCVVCVCVMCHIRAVWCCDCTSE
jgi:hypothetical protein